MEPVFRKKNMETSNKAKDLAIKEMKDLNFQKALLLLNQAVIFLPTGTSNNCSISNFLPLLLTIRNF